MKGSWLMWSRHTGGAIGIHGLIFLWAGAVYRVGPAQGGECLQKVAQGSQLTDAKSRERGLLGPGRGSGCIWSKHLRGVGGSGGVAAQAGPALGSQQGVIL